MNQPEQIPSVKSDVLHSEAHSRLSAEQIAKAQARHQREHPGAGAKKTGKPQKPAAGR